MPRAFASVYYDEAAFSGLGAGAGSCACGCSCFRFCCVVCACGEGCGCLPPPEEADLLFEKDLPFGVSLPHSNAAREQRAFQNLYISPLCCRNDVKISFICYNIKAVLVDARVHVVVGERSVHAVVQQDDGGVVLVCVFCHGGEQLHEMFAFHLVKLPRGG